MTVRMTLKAALVLLPVLLSACQLLGGGTQVRFSNMTTFTLVAVQLGPLIDSTPLAPSSETGYFSIVPGQNVLTAQGQAGQYTNGALLAIVAGHSYTVTFSFDATGTAFTDIIVTMAADN